MPDLILSQPFLLTDLFVQLSTFHEVKNENNTIFLFVDLVDADNIGVI